MAYEIINGPTIKAGESLSDGANCSAGSILRITVPQEFTPADLTFQVSTDGKFYSDLYDAEGNEITVKANPSTGIILREDWVRFIPFVKIRSGSRDIPVEQSEDCKFAIAINK
jgi:hypothetical protein